MGVLLVPMNDEERADYQQQQEEERRLHEERTARYRAANPLWDRCRDHPDRAAVDPGVCTKQFCVECIDAAQDRYVEVAIRRDLERKHTGRASGMGRTYREVNIGSYDSPRIEQVEFP